MNRSTKSSFQTIQGAAVSFQSNVIEALKKYESEREKAKFEASQYKDEESRLSAMTAALKANARSAISRAEQNFTDAVKTELSSLRNELSSHLLTAPSAQFISTLALYRDFGITPGKAEIAALVQMAGGNTLALRCINGLLETTKAGYTVDFPSSDALESDLDAIEKLSIGHFNYSPVELHAAAVEVYGGLPVTFIRSDGTTYEDGTKIDSVRLISSRAFFENGIKALEAMSNRWTDNVIPSISQKDSYSDTTDKNGNTVTAKEQYESDRKATAFAAEIQQEPGISASSKSGQKNYAEVMKNYRQ